MIGGVIEKNLALEYKIPYVIVSTIYTIDFEVLDSFKEDQNFS